MSGAAWTTAGRYGRALVFDGQNDWVTIADTPALDLTGAMTLEAWVYPTTAPSGWRQVVGKEGPSQTIWFLHAASTTSNRPATGIWAGGDERALFGTAQLPVAVWTHLAATYDGAVQRLYVNGQQVSSRAQSGAILTSSGPVRIGGNGIWGEFFAGRIDDVRIYARTLDAGEIQADMARPVAP